MNCPHPKPRRLLFFQDTKCREQNCVNFRPYDLDELVFSAFDRCVCGSGLAHPRHVAGFTGAWDCADILLGRAIPGGKLGAKTHSDPYPFSLFKVKSELNADHEGQSTRPEA